MFQSIKKNKVGVSICFLLFLCSNGYCQIGTLGAMNGLLEGYIQGTQDRQRREALEQQQSEYAIANTDPSGSYCSHLASYHRK